jgi:hypothetical protein
VRLIQQGRKVWVLTERTGHPGAILAGLDRHEPAPVRVARPNVEEAADSRLLLITMNGLPSWFPSGRAAHVHKAAAPPTSQVKPDIFAIAAVHAEIMSHIHRILCDDKNHHEYSGTLFRYYPIPIIQEAPFSNANRSQRETQACRRGGRTTAECERC